jgi:hypothetical protein
MSKVGVSMEKGILAARIRADLAESRIKRKDLAKLTERSLKTIERWTSSAPEYEKYRPTRSEAIVIAYLTGYPVSRYTGSRTDDVLFPLSPKLESLSARLQAVEEFLEHGDDLSHEPERRRAAAS